MAEEAAEELVRIRVIPRARKDEVGSANDAVRKLLSKHFGVSAGSVELVAGLRSRDKTVRVRR